MTNENSNELMKLVLKTTRYSGDHTFFCRKIQKNEEICQNGCFLRNSGNSGGNGLLNSNHCGKGQGKTSGDLGEQVPWVPRGISNQTLHSAVPKSQGFPAGIRMENLVNLYL